MGELKDIKRWGKKAKPHMFALEPRMLFDGVSIVPPENAVPGAQTFNHDTSAIIPGLSVNDADGNLSTTRLSVAHGVVEVDLAGGAVIASGASGSNALTLSGSQAQINAALATLKYKGDSKYVGLDSLSVLSTDVDGNNDADEVLINVNNTSPVAADLFVETNQNQAISGTLVASDAESDPIQFAAIGDEFPVHGTLVINQNGTYTYTPDLNFVGLDSFNYSVEDNANGVNQYTVTVTVNAVNQPPTGENVITSTNEDVDLTEYFPVATDPEGNNPIVYAILVPPSHGEVTINEVDFGGTYYTYTYKPNLNYHGLDSFQYVARDSLGNESIYTVTIDVKSANDAPTSADKTLTIEEDDPYVFGIADFAFNDTIEANTFIAVKITGLPNSGSLKLNGTSVVAGQSILVSAIEAGQLVFTPAPNEYSSQDENGNLLPYDNFYFQVQDSGGTLNEGQDLSSTHVIEIKVTPLNDAPALTDAPGDLLNGLEDEPYTVFANELLQGYSDADLGDTLTVKNLSAGIGFTVALQGNDSYTITAPPNFYGLVTLTYEVTDGVESVVASKTFMIDAVNDAPTSQDNTVTSSEDRPYIFTEGDFSISDLEGDLLSAVKITGLPNNGTLTLDGQLVTTDQFILAKDIRDGLLVFTPVANENGAPYDSFYFQVQDNGGVTNGGVNLSGEHVITININASNDFPVLDGAPFFSINYTENDNPSAINNTITVSDGDNTSLASATVTLDNFVSGEDVLSLDAEAFPGINAVYNATTGVLTLTAAANVTISEWQSALRAVTYQNTSDDPDTKTRSVTYQINDGADNSNLITSSIDITAINDAATISGDTEGSVIEAGGVNNLVAGTPTATGTLNVTDVDDPGKFTAVTDVDASFGTYSVNENGTWTYALDNDNTTVQGLNVGDTLTDAFTVTSIDGTEQVITITINGRDDATNILGDTTGNILEAGGIDNGTNDTPSFIGELSAVDFDDNVVIQFQAVLTATTSDKGYGTYTINEGGIYTYTLDNDNTTVQGLNVGETLTDTFTVKTTDGTEQVITITINGANDAPKLTETLASLPGGNQGEPYVLSAADLLQGYTDVDGDTLAVINLSAGDGFQVQDNGDGTFTITPPPNYNGPVSLTYQVSDGAASVDATQSFTLSAVNQPPELTGEKATLVIGVEDESYRVSAADLLQGYTDVDGDTLTVESLSAGNGFAVTNNGDGTFTITPPPNYNGPVSLTYRVSDGAVSVGATQTFTLAPVNDAPVGKDNTVRINEDLPYALTATDFGFADVDAGDSLGAVTINTLPSDGVLTLNGEAVEAGQVISIADINAGYLTFTPDAKESGLAYASFTFQVADQSGSLDSIPRALTIDVVNMNSVTALSRRDISNEGFKANKKVEELFRLRDVNETPKDAYQIPRSNNIKLDSANPKPGGRDALLFSVTSRATTQEVPGTERLDGTKPGTRLRSMLTPPDPVTDSHGRITYQLPEGIFKGGLGVIKYVATQKDGSPLPAWIQFDSLTGKLIAEVPKEMKAPLEVKVEAVDSRGFKAETTFKILPRPSKPSFEGKRSLSAQFNSAFSLAR